MKTYKNIDSFTKQIESIEIKDWYKIGGHWYTIEEFDDDGKTMRYQSLTEKIEMIITTPDRYKTGLKGAEVELVEPLYYRFSPSYYLPINDYNKLSKEEKRQVAIYINERWGADDLIDYLFS